MPHGHSASVGQFADVVVLACTHAWTPSPELDDFTTHTRSHLMAEPEKSTNVALPALVPCFGVWMLAASAHGSLRLKRRFPLKLLHRWPN